jgi:hypothetical protein
VVSGAAAHPAHVHATTIANAEIALFKAIAPVLQIARFGPWEDYRLELPIELH